LYALQISQARLLTQAGRIAFLEFTFMNDVFINDFGAAYQIAMIQRVPEAQRAQVRNDRRLEAPLVTNLSNNS
jgi:hypothetical protein